MSDGDIGASRPGGSFEIFLVWTEKTLIVGPEETALDVMLRAGLPVEPGCRTGGCGECVTEYVEGDIDHKDACLQLADRRHYFCPCVSRARTRIVIAA